MSRIVGLLGVAVAFAVIVGLTLAAIVAGADIAE